MIEIKSASATGVFRSSVTDIFWILNILNWGLEHDNTPLKKTATFTYISTFENIFFG